MLRMFFYLYNCSVGSHGSFVFMFPPVLICECGISWSCVLVLVFFNSLTSTCLNINKAATRETLTLLLLLFGLRFYAPVNGYGHVEYVSLPNHTFFPEHL